MARKRLTEEERRADREEEKAKRRQIINDEKDIVPISPPYGHIGTADEVALIEKRRQQKREWKRRNQSRDSILQSNRAYNKKRKLKKIELKQKNQSKDYILQSNHAYNEKRPAVSKINTSEGIEISPITEKESELNGILTPSEKTFLPDIQDTPSYRFSIKSDEGLCCNTYYKNLCREKIPPLALESGFKYPNLPECLKDLSEFEERLVAGRIVFMLLNAEEFDANNIEINYLKPGSSRPNTGIAASNNNFDEFQKSDKEIDELLDKKEDESKKIKMF